MADGPRVVVQQVGPSTGQGLVRGHSLLVDRPESKGGADRGAMGGELLLLGLGGCFMSNFLAAVRERDAPIRDVEVTVSSLLKGTPPLMTAFEIHISATHDDRDLLQKIATIAERGCIALNTLKQGISITVSLDE